MLHQLVNANLFLIHINNVQQEQHKVTKEINTKIKRQWKIHPGSLLLTSLFESKFLNRNGE